MNELFYPQIVVANAAPQLEMLPAPDGHPVIDGKPVSAYNPLAINAANFGGFTRSPRMDGKRVVTDLVIDTDVANRSDRGRRIVSRIKNGKKIGVSTGLIADVINAKGKVGKYKYNGKVESITFDHVAILLDAQPAGENTYTLNHDVKNQKKAIRMDTLELDLSNLAVHDRALLAHMTVNELLTYVKREITVDESKDVIEKAGLQVNSLKTSQVDEFNNNAIDFAEFKTKKEADRKELTDFIIQNSKMEQSQLDDMTDAAIQSISESVVPKHNRIANGKRVTSEFVLLDDENLKKEA